MCYNIPVRQGVKNLMNRMGRMKAMKPLFVDFTWGAGGSTADLTLELTLRAKNEHGLVPNMHLTCTNMPVEKIDNALDLCKVRRRVFFSGRTFFFREGSWRRFSGSYPSGCGGASIDGGALRPSLFPWMWSKSGVF